MLDDAVNRDLAVAARVAVVFTTCPSVPHLHIASARIIYDAR